MAQTIRGLLKNKSKMKHTNNNNSNTDFYEKLNRREIEHESTVGPCCFSLAH